MCEHTGTSEKRGDLGGSKCGTDSDGHEAMGVSLLEHRRNEEILEEANVEPIVMVMRQ